MKPLKEALDNLRELTAQRKREHRELLRPIAEVRGFKQAEDGAWIDDDGNEHDRQGRYVYAER